MVVKEGYKNTEVGVIPEDWEVSDFFSLSSRIGDGIHSTPRYTENGEYYFINGNNLNNGSITINESTKMVSLEEFKIHKREIGSSTLLISINGTIGSLAFYNGENVMLGKSVAYINLTDRVNKQFIFQLLQTNYIKEYFKNELTGSTIRNLGLGSIRNTPLVLPSIPEQTAIATVLSDTDNLIQALEKKIAKKELIKKGAMQQLLEPKEGWKVKTLGEVATIKTGSKNNQDKISDGKYPFFVRSQTIQRLNSYSYDCEAILIPGEGGIGSIYHYIKGKFEVHQRVYMISNFISTVNGKFIYFYLKEYFYHHAMKNTVKATVDSLRLPTFLEFEITIPNYEEQNQIAQILSDMDNEIELFQEQLSKYKQVKQGLMQELLTGKIRLV